MGAGAVEARATTVEPSDGALVRRHLAGDEQAFVDIYERFHQRLVLYCRQRVADIGVAEDLAQEAFVRALEALDRFDPSRPLWPWLKTIARRLAIDHARGPDLEVMSSDVDELYTIPAATMREERLDLERTLQNVNDRHALVLRLWYVEDWAADDVCDLMGLTRNALDQLLHRARARLREEYEQLTSGVQAAVAPFAASAVWASDVRARLRAAAHDPMLLGGIAPVEAARQAVAAALIGFMVVGSAGAPGLAGSAGGTLTSSTATFAVSVAHEDGATGNTWHDQARADSRTSARADQPSHATGPERVARSVVASSHELVEDGEGDVSAQIVRGRDTSGEGHVTIQTSGDADGDGDTDVTVVADLRCTTNLATQIVCDTIRTVGSNVSSAQVGTKVGGSLTVAS